MIIGLDTLQKEKIQSGELRETFIQRNQLKICARREGGQPGIHPEFRGCGSLFGKHASSCHDILRFRSKRNAFIFQECI